MSDKNKQNTPSSTDNERAGQADNTVNIAEADLLNKQQELKELEDSLTQKETIIAQKEQDLKAAKDAIIKKEAELNDKSIEMEEMELQAKNGFPILFEEKFAAFKKKLGQREVQCVSELESIEAEKEKLRQRELTIQKAEIQRDNGYADDRAKLGDELFNLRKKQEKELESKRASYLDAIENEVSQARSSRLSSLEKEIADRFKVHEALLQKEKDEFEQKRKVFLKDQAELDELKDDLEYRKHRLQSHKEALEEREANLNNEVDAKVVERKQSFEYEKSAFKSEIARLKESIKTSSALISNFEELKHKLGDEDPAAVLLKLKTYEEDIKRLREDLATCPTHEMQEAFDRLKSEKGELQLVCERLSEENHTLKSSARIQSDFEMQVAELSDKNKSLLRRFESVDADNTRLNDELKRLQAAYVRESDYEKRKINIEKPYIEKEIPRNVCLKAEAEEFLKLQTTKKIAGNLSKDEEQRYSELDNAIGTYEQKWLDGISKSSLEYGLKFPRRILHAFHTALKTSEWSPVTVLAGVSGTGKSELPRLYSHFGGINFLSLSVQPNWDSQESMLGFFNSIDNEFDAREVLRFLVQSQKKQTSDNPFGLEDVMSLILMDEMNLAHVELYFAEFLSKLELRRGLKGDAIPSLPVKLGVGSDFIYPLSLGRNVLWTGTMNQDETTKSLSDKVLDRGIVINFPRPTTLERRRQLKPLSEQAPLLSRKLWESGWCRESKFNDDQILPFKGFIEEMNTSLSNVGRALGHRVWQSIEYYMANYPDVLEAQRNNDDAQLAKAMKVAFEDQLVQKVMPKLRGIETRGESKDKCIIKIEVQIKEGIKEYKKKDGTICKPHLAAQGEFSIGDDYKLAYEMGYGQFIWNSANYIKDDDPANGQENAEH